MALMEMVVENITSVSPNELFTPPNSSSSIVPGVWDNPALRNFHGGVMTFLVITRIFGNSLTLAAIFKFPKIRRCKASWFIASLSASDLAFCLLVMPTQIAWLFGFFKFSDFPLFFCQLRSYFGQVCTLTSFTTLLQIIVNRYVIIVHNSWARTLYGKKSLLAQVLFPWLFWWGLTSLSLAGILRPFTYSPRTDTCFISHGRVGTSLARYFFAIFMVIFALIVTIAYTRIFQKVRQSRLALESFKSIRQGASRPTAQPAISKTEVKLAKTMLITFFVCFFSYIPMATVFIIGLEETPVLFLSLAYVFFSSAATTNFIVYTLFNPEYRNAYRKLLGLDKIIVLPQQSSSGGSAETTTTTST